MFRVKYVYARTRLLKDFYASDDIFINHVNYRKTYD